MKAAIAILSVVLLSDQASGQLTYLSANRRFRRKQRQVEQTFRFQTKITMTSTTLRPRATIYCRLWLRLPPKLASGTRKQPHGRTHTSMPIKSSCTLGYAT